MDKRKFDEQLKNDAVLNKFKIEGDFITFDNTANLQYLILPNFDLSELLTKNPVSSYTKLSKSLLLWLHRLRLEYKEPIYINSGYRSPEYNATIPTASKESWHTKGKALDLGCANPSRLKDCAETLNFIGELGLYNSFIHIAPNVGENVRWDNRKKKSLANYLDSDTKRNYAIYALIAVLAFMLLRRK